MAGVSDPTQTRTDTSVDRLMQVGRARGDVFERDSALAAAKALLFGRASEPVKFGRYVLLERIGAGGQGTVHAAYDPELDRKVAIKLLGTTSNPARRAELLSEAQAAARLAHPNVLAVYDVGAFDGDGRNPGERCPGVYMVTELVDGETLKTWCERPHTLHEKLEILRMAGRGLAAAHASGLVHADFKPANVLIGRDGRVRVADFGIARMMGTPVSAEPHHGSPSIQGTPAYMAPEQHDGAAELDARADVYAFCVTAFEVLYGRRPFEGSESDALAQAKRLRDIRAPPAARVPRWIHRILRRGLEPDPAARAASMIEILAALERDPAGRLRTGAIAGVVVLAIATTAWAAWRERQARAAACDGLDRELVGVWDDSKRAEVQAAFERADAQASSEAWDRVARGLDAYASQWVSLRRSTCEDTVIEERESMAVMSARMLCLERRAARLGGLVRRLVEIDARSLTRAAQGVADLPPLEPCMHSGAGLSSTTIVAPEALVALEAELADVDALRHSDRFAEAEAASDRALSTAETLGDPAALGRVWLQRGALERWRGDFAAAEAALERAVLLGERARDDELVVSALTDLAFVVGSPRARSQEGLRLLDLAEAKLARVPSPAHLVPPLAYHRGRILERIHRYDEAEAAFVEASRQAEELYGSEHPLVADIVNMIGVVSERRGQHDRALAHYERAYAIRRALVGEVNARTAIALANTAIAHWNLGEASVAMDLHRRALSILERTLGVSHSDTAWARRGLADNLLELEQPHEALVHAELALAHAEAAGDANHPWVADSLLTVSEVHRELGAPDVALVHDDRAVEIARRADAHLLAAALVSRAASLRALGRCDESETALAEALTVAGSIDRAASVAHAERGRCAMAEHQMELAASELGQALGIARGRGEGVVFRLPILVDLAFALSPDEREPTETARRVAAEALDIIRRTGVRSSWRSRLEPLLP